MSMVVVVLRQSRREKKSNVVLKIKALDDIIHTVIQYQYIYILCYSYSKVIYIYICEIYIAFYM